MVQFCLKKILLVKVSVADTQDGNELKLKKNWANFFKFSALCLGKLTKTLNMVYSLLKFT